MKIFAIIATALALAASPASAGTAKDGYKFGEAEYTRTDFQVQIVEYNTVAEVTAAAIAAGAIVQPDQVGSYGRTVKTTVNAWSILRENVCIIHMVKAEANYRPEFIGHELAHCIYGRWHP